MKKSFLLFVILITASGLSAREVSIEDINKNPQSFEGEIVTIKGTVMQFIEGRESTTSHYLIKGDFGGQIRVNTADVAPETFVKYKVEGIVYVDSRTRMAFISEKNRYTLAGSNNEGVEYIIEEPVQSKRSNTLLYIIFGAGLLIIFLVIALVIRKKQTSQQQSYDEPHEPLNKSFETDNDFRTIKLNTTSDPKTLKFIPGELKIVTGADTGKTFKIAGYPTSEGNIVTIGRETVNDERRYAHIQLIEKTVSRKQAAIIQTGGKLFVKNLSETNNTQVDGIELKQEETAEIKPNSTIKTGEVEFQYILI